MSRPWGLTYLLLELARTLLTRRVTVRFPFRHLDLPAYFRGKVTIQEDLCEGCGLCVRDCPASALELEREDRHHFRLIHYRDRCAHCGQCADVCRQGAITLNNEFAPATSRRDGLAEVMVERTGETEGCPRE